MKHQKTFMQSFTLLLLWALLLTGCGLDEDASVKENETGNADYEGIQEEEWDIAPISDPLVIEAEETLPPHPHKYLNIKEGISDTKIELHFDEVDPTRCGEYPASASYEGQTIEFTIRIVDTTPPQIMEKEDIPVFSAKDTISCEDLVEIKDISEVDAAFEDGFPTLTLQAAGNYAITIEASDAYGNTSSKNVYITVKLSSTDPSPETVTQIQNDDTLPQAFKDYLLGEKPALIGQDVVFDSYILASPIPAGHSASIQDMYAMIENGDGVDIYLTDVKYGLIDCGMDGKPELAVEYNYYYEHNWDVMTTVLSEQNGSLTLNFNGGYGYRSYSCLYADGRYLTDHSDGANMHSYTYDILDKTGRAKSIYVLKSIIHPYLPNDRDLPAMRDYFGYDSVDEVTKEDKEIIDDLADHLEFDIYKIGTETYTVPLYDPVPDPDDKLSLPYYLSLCEKNGTVFYSTEEIEELIEERKAALGFAGWKESSPKEEISWNILLGDGIQ